MMQLNSKLKEQKVSEGESSHSPVDIISNLPDSILAQILSLLPATKEAVATSILSKRWRYVWTHVHKLVFDNSGCRLGEARRRYDQYVYKVLKVQQGNVKDFTLCGRAKRHNEFDIVSWIDIAISRGVERLHVDINFQSGWTTIWPHSIFSCKTLVDLEMWSLGGNVMDIPSTPIFPCLKKLEVPKGGNGFFKNIISRCSALEHLICCCEALSPINIVSSSLKRLELHCNTSFTTNYTIALHVPSLEYLKLSFALPLLIAGEQLSSLVEADIYFMEYSYYSRNVKAKEFRDSFVRFIQPISNVKLLRIKSSCNKFFDSVGDGMFINLTKLEIVSSFFEWRLLLSFMENSMKLEAISLKKTSTLKKHKLAWKEPKNVPTSLSSSLKKISIHGYSEDELPMVTYVLRTSQILELVDIHCAICYRDNNGWKSDMLQHLQKLHRAGKRCEIVLV